MVKGFTPVAMDMLLKHDWPGNVRELENAIERAVILLQGEFVTERELPLSIPQSNYYAGRAQVSEDVAADDDEGQSLEEAEKKTIVQALRASNGNKSEAARRLGITRRTLYKKLAKYEITEW